MQSNARILLCSSDLTKLEPLKDRLLQAGIRVDCATQADEARQRLWTEHYAGVAVDLLLADRDGISFALELRAEQPWLPIVVLTTEKTDDGHRHDGACPGWLVRSASHARLLFALKQASQRSAGRPPRILHVEHDDDLAQLVRHTLGGQAQLFRARSTQEARIAMSLRDYDLALVSSQRGDPELEATAGLDGPLLVPTDPAADPVLTILGNLRRSPHVHEPAYC